MLGGDVTGPGRGEMAQPLSRQPDNVPAASRRAARAQTSIVAEPEDSQVLDVRHDACIKELDVSYQTFKDILHSSRLTRASDARQHFFGRFSLPALHHLLFEPLL